MTLAPTRLDNEIGGARGHQIAPGTTNDGLVSLAVPANTRSRPIVDEPKGGTLRRLAEKVPRVVTKSPQKWRNNAGWTVFAMIYLE